MVYPHFWATLATIYPRAGVSTETVKASGCGGKQTMGEASRSTDESLENK